MIEFAQLLLTMSSGVRNEKDTENIYLNLEIDISLEQSLLRTDADRRA